MTRYLWVAARRAEGFPTVLCCAAAGVSRQAFYDRRAAQGAAPTARESAEAAPVAEIREIHAASDRAYGSPRVTAELRDRGHRVSPKRVERLMRVHQIAGIRPRRPKRTTTPAPSASKPPDLLGRRFPPGAPDRAWRSDITYIRAGEGWLYLAVVLDVASRRLVGYAMSDRIDTRLVAAALDMAANARGGRTAGIIFHSDHRSQHLAGKLREAAAGWGLAQSAGRAGSSADNAAAESFFSSPKRELVNRRRYPDRASARRSILEWLARYNTHRRHTSLGFLTPEQHELNYRHTETTNPTQST